MGNARGPQGSIFDICGHVLRFAVVLFIVQVFTDHSPSGQTRMHARADFSLFSYISLMELNL